MPASTEGGGRAPRSCAPPPTVTPTPPRHVLRSCSRLPQPALPHMTPTHRPTPNTYCLSFESRCPVPSAGRGRPTFVPTSTPCRPGRASVPAAATAGAAPIELRTAIGCEQCHTVVSINSAASRSARDGATRPAGRVLAAGGGAAAAKSGRTGKAPSLHRIILLVLCSRLRKRSAPRTHARPGRCSGPSRPPAGATSSPEPLYRVSSCDHLG